MLSVQEIKAIVKSGEGYNAEFKVSAGNVTRIAEEVCAFANAAGGVVLVGVDDKNIIKGVIIDNSKRSALQNVLGEISPKLHCEIYEINVDGINITVIEVPSGPKKPYVLSGAIYARQGPNTQKLTTAEEMRDFFQQADRIYFDEGPCKEADFNTDFPDANIAAFRAEAGLNNGISHKQVFDNLRLITEDNYLKNGAVLFFARHPERFFDKAVIRCVHFDGVDKRFIIDDKVMMGTLYQQYVKSMTWIKSKLNVRYDIEGAGSGPRKELWEIPETVFKEAIINSLAHRDYYDKGARITIELFDDRVEIANPGGLVSAIPRSEFGRRSLSRNPLIFGLFERMRMVEQIGSGITRMRDLMEDEGLTLPEFSMDGMFTVILRRPFSFDNWIGVWKESLSDKQIAIINAIHEDLGVKKLQLQKVSGLSASGVDKQMLILKDMGLVKREGTKGGNWVLYYIKQVNK